MATTKTSAVAEARRRAREAKAAADAERIAQEKRVEELTTDYYTATVEIEQLEDELSQARTRADRAVVALLDSGESRDRVATLTGLTAREVSGARRRLAPSDHHHADDTRTPEPSPAAG